MGLGGYLVGALVFAGTWGASAATAALLVRRQLPRLGGVPRVLAFAVLFLAALIAAHLVPGVLGLLSRWSALAVALIGLAAATRFVPRAPGAPNDDTPPAARDSGPVSWALAALAVAALSVYLVAQAWIVSRTPVVGTDALSFELPVIGGWIRSGSLWGIHQFVPLQAQADYPHNGNVVYLAAMQPFRSDFLVRLVSIPFVGLAGLSVYAIGRELRAPRATAALAGVLFAALPAVASTSYYGGKADTITLAAFGTGSLFALRHVRLGRRADLIVAGIGLGLALGAKWYGVPATLVVVGAWAVASLVQRRGVGVVVRGVLALAGLMAAAGGFWFVRNAVGSGSPAFPVAVPLFGSTPHDFVRDCVGFSIAHYAGKPGVLKDYAWPGWKLALGLGGGLLALGWVGALILAAADRFRGREVGPALAVTIGSVAALTVAYVVTPYTALGVDGGPFDASANTRYLGPGLVLAAPLLAWVVGRLGRLRLVAEVAMLVGVGDGVRRAFDVGAKYVVAAAFVLVAGAAAAYALYLVRRHTRLVVAAAGLILLVTAGVGYNRQHAWDDGRYADTRDPVITYLATRANSGHRIALTGTWSVNGIVPTWPAFGDRLGNHVEFAGPFVDGQLREEDNQQAWRARLARGHFDLLVVGRGGYPRACSLPGQSSDDDAWARAAGFPVLARTSRLTLYRVIPPS